MGKHQGKGIIGLIAAGIIIYILISLVYVLAFFGLDFGRTLPPSIFFLNRFVNWCGLIIAAAFVLLRVYFRVAGKHGPSIEDRIGGRTIDLFLALSLSSIATYYLLGYRFQVGRILTVLLPESIVSALRLPLMAVLAIFPVFLIFLWWGLLKVNYRGFEGRLLRFASSALLKWSCVVCLLLMVVVNISAYVFRERIPNVILITIDTLRQDHLGYAGYGRNTSPNMEKLAGDGITFLNATSFSNWTIPSHENMFTGQYPVSVITSSVPLSSELLPEVLQSNEYRTGAFVSGEYCRRKFGLNQGFDFYDDDFPSGIRAIETYYDSITTWLDKEAREPFFLWLHLMEPHFPYEAHDGYLDESSQAAEFDKYNRYFGNEEEMFDLWENRLGLGEIDMERARALYDSEISYIDDYLGRFMDDLKERGLFDDSMIIVTSDHGEGFGEHGIYFSHGRGVTDDMTRVPLIIKMPGNSPKGKVLEGQVQTSDIYATVLDIAGIPYQDMLLSKSLLPLIRGHKGTDRRYAYSYSNRGRSYSVRRGRFKLIYFDEDGEYALYNVVSDSHETADIRAEKPEVFREMKKELDLFMQAFSLFASEQRGEKPPEIDEETRKRLEALGYIH